MFSMRTFLTVVILSLIPFASFASDKVRVLHTIGPQAYHAWIYYGKDAGIYEKHGIDIDILGSGGSAAKTDVALGMGSAEVSFTDFPSVVITNHKFKETKIKMALIVDSMGSDILITRKPIKDLNDLNGMKLGANPNSTSAKLMRIVTNAKPDFVNIPATLKDIALIKGEIEGFTGYSTMNIPKLVGGLKLEENKDFFVTPLVSRNEWTVGRGVVFNDKWATENPDIAKRFVQASIETVKSCYENQPSCLQSLENALGSKYDKDVETFRLDYWYEMVVINDKMFTDRTDDVKIYSEKIAKALDLKLFSVENYYVKMH